MGGGREEGRKEEKNWPNAACWQPLSNFRDQCKRREASGDRTVQCHAQTARRILARLWRARRRDEEQDGARRAMKEQISAPRVLAVLNRVVRHS